MNFVNELTFAKIQMQILGYMHGLFLVSMINLLQSKLFTTTPLVPLFCAAITKLLL